MGKEKIDKFNNQFSVNYFLLYKSTCFMMSLLPSIVIEKRFCGFGIQDIVRIGYFYWYLI